METFSAPRNKTIVELAEDQIWLYENWEKLCKAHPKQVVGVEAKTVVAVAQSYGHLYITLRAGGLRPADVAKAYMDTDPDRTELFLKQREGKIKAIREGDILP